MALFEKLMNKMKEVDEDHKMWGKTIMNHDITRFASNPGSPADSPKDADDVNVSGVNIALKHLDSPICSDKTHYFPGNLFM